MNVQNYGPMYRIVVCGASLLLASAAQATPHAPAAAAPRETVLYSFSGSPDGQFPQARVMRDGAGNLFGTTVRGGSRCNCGTVYKLTPRGSGFSESVIYSADKTAGRLPIARLFQDKSGNLFGSLSQGGMHYGGAVFKIVPMPSGGYSTSIIHAFSGTPGDGSQPEGALISDGTNLFGTTYEGGISFCHAGTAYELSPSGNSYTERVINNFCGGNYDGSGPAGPLVIDNSNEVLYGTTQHGGQHHPDCTKGCGTVFKLTPSRGGYVESIIHYFSGGTDGAYPVDGLLMDKSGALYGTTQGGGNPCAGNTGCGTVFKLTPGSGGVYTESVIYRFASSYDGVQPAGSLVVDKSGVLYGTTTKSVSLNSCDCGTVFSLTTVGSSYQETILYAFQGGVHDGSAPYAGLVLDQPDRVLYGTTTTGGVSNDGTVFQISL